MRSPAFLLARYSPPLGPAFFHPPTFLPRALSDFYFVRQRIIFVVEKKRLHPILFPARVCFFSRILGNSVKMRE